MHRNLPEPLDSTFGLVVTPKSLGTRPVQRKPVHFDRRKDPTSPTAIHEDQNSQLHTQKDVSQVGTQVSKKRQNDLSKLTEIKNSEMVTKRSDQTKTPASRTSILASEIPTSSQNQQFMRQKTQGDQDGSLQRLSDNDPTIHQNSTILAPQVTFVKPTKVGDLQIRKIQYIDTPKQVSALQETKKKVSRFVELYKNVDKNTSGLDIELTEEIMRASKEQYNSSVRPQTTKTGTISEDVREMMSSGGFFQSPTSSAAVPERRLQTGQPVPQQLQRKHNKSFGSQTIVQTSQQYKLAKKLPDVFKSLQKQDGSSLGGIFPITNLILSPKATERRGMSAAAGTRNRITIIDNNPNVVPDAQHHASSTLPEALKTINYENVKRGKASAVNLSQSKAPNFKNAQTSLGPHPDPFKYLQPTSHIKVPEFLRQQLSLQISYNTAQSNMLPFSPTSGLLPVHRIDVRSDSIEQYNAITDRNLPKITSADNSQQDEEVKTITSQNEKSATPKTVVFQKKPQIRESERLDTMPTFSTHERLTDQEIANLISAGLPDSRESFERRRSQGIVSKNDLEIVRTYPAPSYIPAPNVNLDFTNQSKGIKSSLQEESAQEPLKPQKLTTVHKLESRKDPNAFLPVSTDLIPQNLYSKAIHKLTNDFQWDQVAEIPLYKTEDGNFFTDLHKVKREAMSALYQDLKSQRDQTQKTKHIGVDSEHKLPSSTHSTSEHLISRELTLLDAQQKFNYEEMLKVDQNDKYDMMMFNQAICNRIKHPIFCLPERPDVIQSLYQDVILTVMNAKSVNLYIPRSDDYLDDTKDAPADLVRSVMLKLNYMKYEIEEKAKELEQIKQKQAQEKSKSGNSQKIMSLKRESETFSAKQSHLPTLSLRVNSLGMDSMKHLTQINTPARGKESIMTVADSEKLDLAEMEVNDCEKRRIVFSLVEADTFTEVLVKLEVDFEAMMKLQRKIPRYQDKRIERVLPLYFFDDFEEECNSIQELIYDRVDQAKPELQVQVTMKEELGDGIQKRVIHTGRCLDYIQETKQFFVELDHRKIVTSRLCVLFNDLERQQELEERRVKAMILQKNAFVRLNIERIFVDEVLKLMPKVRQSAKITNGIYRKLGIPMSKIEKNAVKRKKVKKMVKEAEAIYCYSQVKAVAMAELEQENPKLACMVTGYKVERNRAKQVKYYGLAASDINGGPIQHFFSKKQATEIIQNYSLTGRICFYNAMQFVNQKKLEFLDSQIAFCIPFDEKTLLLLSQRLDQPKRVLQEKFTTFPQRDLKICEAQITMCQRYKTILQDNYYSKIISYVEKMIYKEFPITTGSMNAVKDVSQLNPFLMRFFNSLSSFQGGHLFEKLENELDKYLKFLLSFAARSLDFRASAEMAGFKIADFDFLLQKQPFIKITVKTKKKATVAEPKQRKENVRKKAILRIIKQMKRDNDKFTVSTTPPMEDIYAKLMSVLNSICALFKDVRRPEKIVYPKLKLENDCIKISAAIDEVDQTTQRDSESDQGKSERTKNLDECQIKKSYIEYIIGELMDLTAAQVKTLRSYTRFFGKTFDDFLRECKQHVYEDLVKNQLTDDSEDERQSVSSNSKPPNEQDKDGGLREVTVERVMKEISRIELTELQHEQFYFELQQVYSDVLGGNKGEYDFGLTLIECKALKQRAISDIETLIDAYQNHLITTFDKMCNELLNRNIKIWERIIEDNTDDIDRTIAQMQYIESLQSDDCVGETLFLLERVQKYKFFLDSLRIKISQTLFEKASELYRFPQRLDAQIKSKYEQLLQQQGNIKQRIKVMSKEQKELMLDLLYSFDCLKYVGLITTAELNLCQSPTNKLYLKDMMFRTQQLTTDKDKQDPNAVKIVWDQNFVNSYKYKFLDLIDQMKKAEDEIKLINSREEQLNIKTTQFPEMLRLRNESRPMQQLWRTIISFNDNFEEWRNQTIQMISTEVIEEEIQEWQRKINFAQRAPEIFQQKGPMQFITYIRQGMDYLKDFLPLLLAIKAKGLERRHFQMIFNETGADINLQRMTIADIIQLQIHKGLVLEKIKAIAENASKEHSIKVTLEQVENDVYSSDLTIIPYRDTGSYIIKGIDDFISTLEECDQKTSSVSHSPYARFFKERIDRLEKELKEMISFFQTWKALQKIWAYLIPIFSQKDLMSQMQSEFSIFASLDKEYREIMNWALKNAKTFKAFSSRENLIPQAIQMTHQFEQLMQALIKYLEAKRKYFPRLYFLSNEEIIEIVGMTDDVFVLQKNMYKMFDGISEFKVIFTGSAKRQVESAVGIIEQKKKAIYATEENQTPYLDSIKVQNMAVKKKENQKELLLAQKQLNRKSYLQEKKEKLEQAAAKQDGIFPEIYGVKNIKGEELIFNQTITVTSCVEAWLKQLEKLMAETVSESVRNASMNLTNELNNDPSKGFFSWIQKWPTQFLLISLEINLQRMVRQFFKKFDSDQAAANMKAPTSLIRNLSDRAKSQSPVIDQDTVYQNFFKKQQSIINNEIYQLTYIVKEQLNKNTRQKVNNLLITRVHHRDTIQNLLNTSFQNASSFLWSLFMKIECKSITQESYNKYLAEQQKLQLDKVMTITNSRVPVQSNRVADGKKSNSNRGQNLALQAQSSTPDHIKQSQPAYNYKPPDNKDKSVLKPRLVGEVELEVIMAIKPYGYEFAENTQRLVITPLTERAFQSLFLALNYDYGGAPIGPVGTGKTETIKELSKRCGRHCYVFNCQSGIDFESMSKFFKGMAASGTWTCFDEFNRLQIEVLSIISQLIIQIQEAKHAKVSLITIEGTEVNFESECALFITMNPFFLGRTKLPDNLAALFRNITMVVPDSMFIAEILLYSSGFIQAKTLSLKITKAFQLSNEQLSNQKHYDFGLRSIKSVLVLAQQIKLRALKVKTNDMIELEEAQQLLADYIGLLKAPEQATRMIKKTPVFQRVQNKKKNRFNTDDESSEEMVEEQVQQDLKEEIELPQEQLTTVLTKNPNRAMLKDLNLSVGLDVANLDLEKLQPSHDFTNQSFILDKEKIDPIQDQLELQDSKDSNELLRSQEEGFSILSSQESVSQNSAKSDPDLKRKQINIDSEYVMTTLGCDDDQVLHNEDALEEFIVLKALLDNNMSKLGANDTLIFKNILMDIFPTTPFPNFELSALQDAIKNMLQANHLHDGEEFVQTVISLYEAVQSRHGIMIVGEAQSGKSRTLQLLVEVLNKIHEDEVQKLIRNFLIEKAEKLQIPWKEVDHQIVCKFRDLKLENLLKIKDEEIKMIKQTCSQKGIENRVLNPKSVSIQNLMGNFEETSREWTDGLLTFYMRQASLDKTGRKQIITFDGSIEPDWVENMNSVLDDNKRLTLITGETIYLTPQMGIILETADLAETSPATISRCAIVYVKSMSLPIKAQFNKWLRSLPSVLKDQIERIDVFANFFMCEIFDRFINKDFMIYPITKQWLVANFIKVFNSLIYDYNSQKHADKKAISALASKGIFNKDKPLSKKSNKDLRDSFIRSSTIKKLSSKGLAFNIKTANELANDASFDPGNILRQSQIQSSLATEAAEPIKPPDYNFKDNDVMFENSVKKIDLWIESMLIQAILLSVGSLLNPDGKRQFDIFIRDTIKQNHQSVEIKLGESISSYRQSTPLSRKDLLQYEKPEYTPTEDFIAGRYMPLQVQVPSEENSIFEYFFDTQTSKWQRWQYVFQYVNEEKAERMTKNIFQMFVNTIDSLRYQFVLERMNATSTSVLMIGPTAVGKSWLFRNFLTSNQSNKDCYYKMISCSSITEGENFAANVEYEYISISRQVWQPANNKSIIVMIDDLNLPKKDKYGIQSCSEIIRQWFDYGGWYNYSPIYFKQLMKMTLFATLSIKDPTQEQLTRRFSWHWATVGYQNESGSHVELIFQVILSRTIQSNWPKNLTTYAYDKIQEATFEFYKAFNTSIQNTPKAFLQMINQRHCLQIINSIVDIYPPSIRNKDHIAQLWLSEVTRTVIDRYEPGKEKTRVYKMAQEVCHEVFNINLRLLPNDPDIPHYCYGLPEFEDRTYIQMPNDDYKKLSQQLYDTLADYNKNHYKNPMDIVIFNTIVEKTVKINRSLYLQNAISILISEEGSGSDQIVKMAIHLSKSTGQQLQHSEVIHSLREDYRVELKQILLFASTESKHQVVLNIYETDLLQPGLLEDLNAIAAHGELIELFQKEEIDNMIAMAKMNFGGASEKQKTKEQLLENIRQKCREDLKIFIQLTPRADLLSKKLRNYLHIVNSACIIHFGDLSRQGFEFVAKKYLMEDLPLPLDQPQEVIAQMIEMYYDSCQEAVHYYDQTEHYIYIQAQHFENFCSIFKEIFTNRMVELTAYKDRFSRGLNGIHQTEIGTAVVQDRLSKESPKLVEYQKIMELKMEKYDHKRELVCEKMKTIFNEESDLIYQFEEARRIKATCERNLMEVIPVLNDAIEGLLLIKKEDIDEIKSYKNPSTTLRTLMQALCIVLRVAPVLYKNKDSDFEQKEDYWLSAQGPQVLGDKHILQRLSTIQPKTLDEEQMISLERLCDREELQPEKIKRACTAAQGIVKWLRAVRDYYFVYKTSVPTRDKAILSEIQYQKIEAALKAKREEIHHLEQTLSNLRIKLLKNEQKIRVFRKNIEDSYIMRSKASRLLNALISEKQKWSVFEAVAIEKLRNIEGDSLIAAATVCFLAPFQQVYRENLFLKWSKNIEMSKIPITKDLDFNKQFGDPLIIKRWIDNSLSNDAQSIQNAICLHLTQIQSILIDPQGQANKWLRNQITDVQIINMETSKYQAELSLALRIGSIVLLENVGDTVPRKLYPIFKLSRQKHQVGKQRTILLDNEVCNVHQDFRVYITTLIKTPDYGSELSLIVNYINFSVTKEAFTQQILSLILQELEAELYETDKQYRKKTLVKLQEMRDIEEDILDTLKEGKGDEQLISEQTLIEKLEESTSLSKSIAQVLFEIQKNIKKIQEVSSIYKPAADQVKQFFFLAMDLNKLNPMYVFTHEWFLSIFVEKIKDMQKEDIKNKCEWIKKEFQRHFFEQVCLTLCEKDKLIFSFLISYKLLEIECEFDMRLVEFFIKGPLQETQEAIDVAIEADASTDLAKTMEYMQGERNLFKKRKKNVPWITKQQWIALDKLSQIAPFNTTNSYTNCNNLSEHILKNPNTWLDWLNGMVKNDYSYKDQEFLVEVEKEEQSKSPKISKKSDLNDSQEAVTIKPEPKIKVEESESDDMVNIDNNQFFLRRVESMRMLGLLIPGGYEESNYFQEKILRKKNKEQDKMLIGRLRQGMRKLDQMPSKAFVDETDLDQIFAYDLDSDNNNTDIDKPPEEENVNKGLKVNTIEEDQEIAMTIMDGVQQYTEFKVEKQINRLQERRKYRYKTIIQSDLAKLCILRCFQPEKIMFEIRSFISKFTGPQYQDSPSFSWYQVLKTTNKYIPTLFMTGQNVNCYEELKFAKSSLIAYQHLDIVYQPVGSISNEKLAKLLIDSACRGNWVLLDNLHLQLELLPNIQKFIEVMVEMHQVISKRITKQAVKSYGEAIFKARQAKKKQNQNDSSESGSEYAQPMPRKSMGRKDDSQEIELMNTEKFERKMIKEELKTEMPAQLTSKIKYEKKAQRSYVLKKLQKMEDESRMERADRRVDLSPEEKEFKDLKFPESFGFPIHKDFRLWLSTIQTPQFPLSFARKCNKISLELPAAIRQNCIKTINHMNTSFFKNGGSYQVQFKRLFFSMIVMHAVISQRERFGSFGWTQPYSFSPNDIKISLLLLAQICNQLPYNKKIPIELLQYSVGHLGYGGNVTNAEDKRTLMELIKTFICQKIYTQVEYRSREQRLFGSDQLDEVIPELYDLTGTQYDPMRQKSSYTGLYGFTVQEFGKEKSYFMPKQVDQMSKLIEYVREVFPIVDRPQIFGLHPSASIKSIKDYGNDIMHRVYVHQFVIKRAKRPLFSGSKFDEKQLMKYESFRAKLIKIRFDIPPLFRPEEYLGLTVEREKSFNALIHKEVNLYNNLIAHIMENCDETLAAIDGTKLQNERTENTFECIQYEKTPREWIRHSYPASNILMVFVKNLKTRVTYIRSLLDESKKKKFDVQCFWLPGFFDQRNFLTTLIQIYARKTKVSIETLKLSYRFIEKNEHLLGYAERESQNIFYINGLWIYGADWTSSHLNLEDPKSQAPSGHPMPTIEVTIVEQNLAKQEVHAVQSLDESATFEMLKRDEKGQIYDYMCPLYVNFQKNRILNKPSEQDGQLIAMIPLPIKNRKPSFWVKRAICMLCYNEDITDNDI